MHVIHRALLWLLGYTKLPLLGATIKFYIIFSFKAFICIIVTTHAVLLFPTLDEGEG